MARKVKNLFIKPGLQMRFGFYLTSATLLFASILLFTFLAFNLSQLGRLATVCSPESGAARVSENFLISGLVLVVLYIVLSIVAFFVSFETSHRVFGPEAKILKHIESLLAGHHDVKTTLREKDQFREIAEKLNQLSQKLKKSQ